MMMPPNMPPNVAFVNPPMVNMAPGQVPNMQNMQNMQNM
jgi:hypothetical protein